MNHGEHTYPGEHTRRCPDLGSWRAHLDGEAAITGPEEHLAVCAECAATVAELRQNADFARSTLAVLDRPIVRAEPKVIPAPRRSWSWMKGIAAAAVAAVFLATPLGQDAAQALLSTFRVQRFNLVQVTTTEAARVAEALWTLGTIEGDDIVMPDFSPVSLGEAEARTGLDLPVPAEIDESEIEALVIPASEIRWTLHGDMIATYLAAEGSPLDIPDGIDGTTVVLQRSDAIVGLVGDPGAMAPEIVIGVSGPIGATSTGASLGDVREFLLELPGIPDSLVGQLSAIEDWETTLPIPVPADEGSFRQVDIDGTSAVAFAVDGLGSGYFWVDGDRVVGIAGDPAQGSIDGLAAEMVG